MKDAERDYRLDRPSTIKGICYTLYAVCAVLFEGLPVADAVSQLLQRDARDE